MIGFSFEQISKRVMAEVALRHHLHPEKPQLLTDDHRQATDLMIEEAFHHLCMSLVPFVQDFSVRREADLLMVELQIPSGMNEGQFMPALDAAIVCYTLYLLASGVDASWAERKRQDCGKLIDAVRRQCGAISPTSVRPCWY